jgi:hypothetical protein
MVEWGAPLGLWASLGRLWAPSLPLGGGGGLTKNLPDFYLVYFIILSEN